MRNLYFSSIQPTITLLVEVFHSDNLLHNIDIINLPIWESGIIHLGLGGWDYPNNTSYRVMYTTHHSVISLHLSCPCNTAVEGYSAAGLWRPIALNEQMNRKYIHRIYRTCGIRDLAINISELDPTSLIVQPRQKAEHRLKSFQAKNWFVLNIDGAIK